MIKKEKVLKAFAIIAALVMVSSLCSCGKSEAEPEITEPQVSKEDNVPDNVVPPITQAPPETIDSLDTTEPPETGEDETTDPTSVSEANQPGDKVTNPNQTEPAENDDPSITYAIRYLNYMRSDKIHIKFVEVSSFDGENIFSIGREVFVDGSNRIYINDSVTTMIRDGIVTVIDYDSGTYYSYPDDGTYSPSFGYDLDSYRHISTEETDSGFSEIYTISENGITSTWTFSNDGSLMRVSDRSLDDGYFTLYNFEAINSDISEMDFNIPEGFTETDPDEFSI